MSDIIKLADSANSGAYRSPEQMLIEALEEVRSGAWSGNKKMLILTVDEEDNQYSVNFMQAGMRMTQCISLCEVGKILFLTEMNYTRSGYGDE